MKCGACGAETVTQETRDLPYSYRGVTTTLHAISAQFCSTCGEATMDHDEADHYGKLVSVFKQQVNRDTGEPELIEGMIEALALSQAKAATVLGIPERKLWRILSGSTAAPENLVKLATGLAAYPGIAEEFVERSIQRTVQMTMSEPTRQISGFDPADPALGHYPGFIPGLGYSVVHTSPLEKQARTKQELVKQMTSSTRGAFDEFAAVHVHFDSSVIRAGDLLTHLKKS